MRQAGFKPKSHSSGVYWVRASSKSGGKKKSGAKDKKEVEREIEPTWLDKDGDGHISWDEWAQPFAVGIGIVIAVGFLFALELGWISLS